MSFKPIRAESTTFTISLSDPAIDRDAVCDTYIEGDPDLRDSKDDHSQKRTKAWHAFQVSLFPGVAGNPALIKERLTFKTGEEPTEFVIGVIPPDEFARISDETEFGEVRFWRCFVAALQEVRGWPEPVPKKSLGDIDYVDPAWARRSFVRGLRDVAIEVGRTAWLWNQMTEEDAKN